MFLVFINGSLSHFIISVLSSRGQLLTLTCPWTIFLAHKLRSASCRDDFSFRFYLFFSWLKAIGYPSIQLQKDSLLSKISHIIVEL